MKVSFAGVPGGGWLLRERELNNFWDKRLFSYYWIIDHKFDMTRNKPKNKVELFLDSGAFSAWSQGVSIDINDYITFIKDNKEYIDVYANLDVIGDAEATLKNQKIMEDAGLSPIPTFHFGEEESYLTHYLKNYEYIALGGMVRKTTSKQLELWFDRLFKDFICDKDGMPKAKVHGFGMTSLNLMLKYPWYSVDSTSWVMNGRMGKVYIPYYKDGKHIYDKRSLTISVSNRSPDLKKHGAHFMTLPKSQQKWVLEYIEQKGYGIGKSEFKKVSQNHKLADNEKWSEKKPKDPKANREVEIVIEPGLSNTYQLRDELNIIYFLDLEKHMPQWPWQFKKEEILNSIF